MIYKVLGGVSVFVGAVFGLIALAALVPFLNTFSGSLFILVAVFGIVAWVFLAIGWQLLRPPKVSLQGEGEPMPAEETEGEPVPEEGRPQQPQPDGRPPGAVAPLGDEEEPSDAPIDVTFSSDFSSFDVVPPEAAEEGAGEPESVWAPEVAGMSIDDRLAAAPTTFKKPYRTPTQEEDGEE